MIPTLKHSAANALGHAISFVGIQVICQMEKNPKFNIILLKTITEQWKVNLVSIPVHLHQDLCFQILNIIEHRFYLYRNTVHGSKVLEKLLEMMSHLKLYKLSFSQVPYTLRYDLYRHLPNLSELRSLEIKSVIMISSKSIREIELLIIKALPNLKNLNKLTLYSYCTDKIVKVVQQRCLHLWYLNVKFSKSITDKSVPALVRCHHLRELILTHSSLTTDGYVNLFLGQSGLNRLVTHADMNEILSRLMDLTSTDFTLDICELEISNVENKHLKFISRTCPKLRSLKASCDGADFSILKDLVYLERLTLTKANFIRNGTEFLLTKLGENLQALKLYRVDDLDFEFINRACPKLKELMIDNCRFKTIVQFEHEIKSGVTVFEHLEHLTCGENFPEMYIDLLLKSCRKVRFLYLADVGNYLTDQKFTALIRNDSLTFLEELCIYKSKYLTIKSIELLVKNCKGLKKLFGLERFASVSDKELKIFVQEHRELNVFTLEGPMFLQERFNLPW